MLDIGLNHQLSTHCKDIYQRDVILVRRRYDNSHQALSQPECLKFSLGQQILEADSNYRLQLIILAISAISYLYSLATDLAEKRSVFHLYSKYV